MAGSNLTYGTRKNKNKKTQGYPFTYREILEWGLWHGWIINIKSWDVILYPCHNFKWQLSKTTTEVRAWMSKYIHTKLLDVITYPCHVIIRVQFPAHGRGLLIRQNSNHWHMVSVYTYMEIYKRPKHIYFLSDCSFWTLLYNLDVQYNQVAPSHYLIQCWLTVNWALRNKLWWNFNPNTNISSSFNMLNCKLTYVSVI